MDKNEANGRARDLARVMDDWDGQRFFDIEYSQGINGDSHQAGLSSEGIDLIAKAILDAGAPAAPVLPDKLDAELLHILGMMCFQCVNIAQYLRETGIDIPKKAEHEQAQALFWMLKQYLKHGPAKWREEGRKEMRSFVKESQDTFKLIQGALTNIGTDMDMRPKPKTMPIVGMVDCPACEGKGTMTYAYHGPRAMRAHCDCGFKAIS